MNSIEKPQNTFEGKREQIPTQENIREIFERLIGDKEYEEIRICEDDQGLYLWEIRVSEGYEEVEYSYMRAGRYKEGEASDTAIHIMFFDQEGVPVGGHSVAKYIDGEWKIFS